MALVQEGACVLASLDILRSTIIRYCPFVLAYVMITMLCMCGHVSSLAHFCLQPFSLFSFLQFLFSTFLFVFQKSTLQFLFATLHLQYLVSTLQYTCLTLKMWGLLSRCKYIYLTQYITGPMFAKNPQEACYTATLDPQVRVVLSVKMYTLCAQLVFECRCRNSGYLQSYKLQVCLVAHAHVY